MFAIGLISFANAIPLMLTSSTLVIWLKEYGLSYTAIGLFSLLHIPYGIKFLWAPLLDTYRVPWLTQRMGRRRSWLLVVQAGVLISLLMMSQFNPVHARGWFVLFGVSSTFFAASQHILLLAYQVETMAERTWGAGEATSVLGFRLSMMATSAGTLYLASFISWQHVYEIYASLILLGIGILFVIPEPTPLPQESHSLTWIQKYYTPFQDFFVKQGGLIVLVFMILFRLPDNLLSTMPNLFYLSLGFSKIEIANASKVFGFIVLIIGGFIGAGLINRLGWRKTLYFAGALHGIALLMFLGLQSAGYSLPWLYATIMLESFTNGLALTAFFTYQMRACRPVYAASQLALITATASISQTIVGSISGYAVDQLGWRLFFILVIVAMLPGLCWISRLPDGRVKKGPA